MGLEKFSFGHMLKGRRNDEHESESLLCHFWGGNLAQHHFGIANMRIRSDLLGIVFNTKRPSNLHVIGRSPPITFGCNGACQGTALVLRVGKLKWRLLNGAAP